MQSKFQFLSTTYDKFVVSSFMGDGCCKLIIKVEPGVHVLWNEDISYYPDEKEILIGPPFKFEIESVDKGVYNIRVSPTTKYKNNKNARNKTRKINS